MKVSQYPRSADGNPLDLVAGVLTDDTGNGGARTPPVFGPDGASIDQQGLLLIDPEGNLVIISNPVATRTALAAIPAGLARKPTYLSELGREGTFVFSSANLAAAVTADPLQAIYVAPASDPTGASGAWVRRYSGAVDARWFGVVADGVTDNFTALQAFLDFGGSLLLPYGEIYCSQRLQVRKSMVLRGVGYGFDARIAGYDNMPGSRIRFPNDQGGIIAWTQTTNNDTSDVVGNPVLYFTQEGTAYSTFKDFALIGSNAGGAVTGFESRTRIHIDNVHCIQFKGKGFDIQGAADIDDAGSDYGNPSLTTIRGCRAVECGSHGFNVRGRDSSVILLEGCDAIQNAGWGYLHNSFSGGILINCHAAANALGCYKESSAIAATGYYGCYVEGGAGANSDVSYPCVVSSGNFSGVASGATNAHTLGPPPTVIHGQLSNFNQIKLTWGWDPPGVIANVCHIQRHDTHGLWLQGHGATFDLTIRNRNNQDVLQNPAATQDLVAAGDFYRGANKILGVQGAAITDAAVAAAAPTKAEFDALVGKFNALLARVRAGTGHGLIA